MPSCEVGKMKKWKCPKCKREFEKQGQGHSCRTYPVKKHFERKELARKLYAKLKSSIIKNIGPTKIESLPCCIHFVRKFTFAAVFPMKDRIRITFATTAPIKNKRIKNSMQISKNRFYNVTEVSDYKEIDKQLIDMLRKASEFKKVAR